MDWVAFDLETTGIPRTSRIVEIGARRFHADGRVDDFTTLVQPGIPIPRDVQRIHGITDEMVRDAPGDADAIQQFLAFAQGAALVAHNAAFDAGILCANADRLGIPVPDVPLHDSVRLTRRLVPHLWSYRLSALARTFGLASEGFHRALPDAVVAGTLVQRLLAMRPFDLSAFPLDSAGCLGPLRRFSMGPTRLAEMPPLVEVEASGQPADPRWQTL